MVSTRKKKQSNRRLLSQLDDFDRYVIMVNTAIEGQENFVANEGTNYRNFTIGTSSDIFVTNENTVKVETLERYSTERIDGEMCNIVDTVGDRNQIGILTAIDSIVTPKIELAIGSISMSSRQNVTSVTANSELGNM